MFLVALSEYDQVLVECDNEVSWLLQHATFDAYSFYLHAMLSEPNGGIQGVVPDDHHVSVVPQLLRHTLPKQEGLARGEDPLLSLSRLFPRIRW